MAKKKVKPAPKRKPAAKKASKATALQPLRTRIIAIALKALQVPRNQVGVRYRMQAGLRVKEIFPFANLEDIMSVICPVLTEQDIAIQWINPTMNGTKASVVLRLICARTMDTEDYNAEASMAAEDGEESSEAAVTKAKKIALSSTFNLQHIGGCHAETRQLQESKPAAKKSIRRSASFLQGLRSHIHKVCSGQQNCIEKVFAKIRDYYGVDSPQDIPAKDDEGNNITADHIKSLATDFARKLK